MTLTIQPVPARRGARWMQDGLRQFARHPMAFGLMFAVSAAAVTILSLIPGLGTIILLSANPLIGLGFMVATEAALKGTPIHPGQFLAPLTTDAARRKSLIILSLASGLANLAVAYLSHLIDGGAALRLAAAMQSQSSVEQMQQAMQDGRLRAGMLFRTGAMTLVALICWYAAAFIHWGRQGWAQSVFSSVLCLWRTAGAALVFALTWMAVFLVVSTLCRLLLSVLGLSSLSLPFIFGLALVFVTAGLVSLLFAFTDSVRESATPPTTPPSPPAD